MLRGVVGMYEMWLNYDNDGKTFRFPVLPEKLKVTVKGESTTFNIDQIGEVFHKGPRGAQRISFSSYFPAVYGSYCQVPEGSFRRASECHAWIMQLMEAKKPAHFILVGGPMSVNCYVLITSYAPSEDGGDVGTVSYTIELAEYRSTSLRKVRNTNAVSKGNGSKENSPQKSKVVSEPKNRVSNKEQATNVTVKSGDCLWNLAKKYYGSGAMYTKILEANRTELDKAAKAHGYSSCNNGNILFPGTVLTIPAA